MPLSRLSPRNSRSALARPRASARQRADGQRHLQLWSAIRSTREEIDSWQRRVQQVEGLFNAHIAPREHELTQSSSTVTERLIAHFCDTPLDIPDKSLLGLWITENLNALQDHPFGSVQKTLSLTECWREALNIDGPVENQLTKLLRQHESATSLNEADDDQYEPEWDNELHSSHDDETTMDQMSTTQDHEQICRTDRQDNANAEQSDNATEKPHTNTSDRMDDNIRSLEDNLSIERLFRQLAKVLHPDREQDDTLRAQKHVLMSQCLKARQDKDINTLLTLYCEHVGELPDELNSNSHNELVEALELQLNELQAQLRQMRFGDPLQALIVERYSSSTLADCERRIHAHAQSLDNEIFSANQLIIQLDTEDGLLGVLDERRSVEQDRLAINEMTGLMP